MDDLWHFWGDDVKNCSGDEGIAAIAVELQAAKL